MDRIEFDGAALRRAREARGWSQREMADRIKALGGRCAWQQISAWESGKGHPAGPGAFALVHLIGLETVCATPPDQDATLAVHHAATWRLIQDADGQRHIIGPDGLRRGPLSDQESAAILAMPRVMERII